MLATWLQAKLSAPKREMSVLFEANVPERLFQEESSFNLFLLLSFPLRLSKIRFEKWFLFQLVFWVRKFLQVIEANKKIDVKWRLKKTATATTFATTTTATSSPSLASMSTDLKSDSWDVVVEVFGQPLSGTRSRLISSDKTSSKLICFTSGKFQLFPKDNRVDR